jgi:hypothetical protein
MANSDKTTYETVIMLYYIRKGECVAERNYKSLRKGLKISTAMSEASYEARKEQFKNLPIVGYTLANLRWEKDENGNAKEVVENLADVRYFVSPEKWATLEHDCRLARLQQRLEGTNGTIRICKNNSKWHKQPPPNSKLKSTNLTHPNCGKNVHLNLQSKTNM